MEGQVDISVEFAGMKLANPVWLASGTCGYADEMADFLDLNGLGGFITKSITLNPRMGNPVPRIIETDAGMLNAIGLANVGVDKFIEEKLPILAGMKPAIFVNVAGETIEEYVAVVEKRRSAALPSFRLTAAGTSPPCIFAGRRAPCISPLLIDLSVP